MDKAKTRILVLVEGAKTDVKLMIHLLSVYGISADHEIVPYNTNIYTLYHQMFSEHDPDSYDLLQILKEHARDESQKALFDQTYSDILLIFDLDPHAPDFSSEKITEMLTYFRESSDMGKLYLNYPMVEAFYHMRRIPDPDFCCRMATMEELRSRLYKTRVQSENRNRDYRKFATTRTECNIVIRQNIEKSQCITNMYHFENLVLPDATDILQAQLSRINDEQRLYVLCTCVFYIVDYNPLLLTEKTS